jgi:hypothetical protein
VTERLGIEAADPMYVARPLYTATGLSMVQAAENAAMRRMAAKIKIEADIMNALSGQAVQGDQ